MWPALPDGVETRPDTRRTGREFTNQLVWQSPKLISLDVYYLVLLILTNLAEVSEHWTRRVSTPIFPINQSAHIRAQGGSNWPQMVQISDEISS